MTLWRAAARRVRSAGDRGVGLVEYAMALALVALMLVAVVESFQESESDRLESSGARIGTPDLDVTPTVPPTIPPGGGDGGGSGSGTTSVVVSSVDQEGVENSNAHWTASVGFHLDGGGTPPEGVVITGTWEPSSTTSHTSCTTTASGGCTVSRWKLSNSSSGQKVPDDSATFTVTGISGPGYVAGDGVVGSTYTIARPGSTPAP
ncbi:hypothetical protein [Actinomarinicola tropica]|uniref:Uncharacterized protein n=1 Tax=Actinomarinicola tropica TaxID=2789776 RepID=A0A5Q2RJI9_9ACTN|nr:hypothetical protein [Actinomarinicola tropica]QGG95062.1 hypothetical protein GH723_08050 [Actinomarinicola tropica]